MIWDIILNNWGYYLKLGTEETETRNEKWWIRNEEFYKLNNENGDTRKAKYYYGQIIRIQQ